MTSSIPTLAFERLPAPPPPGAIQFFDGYFPALTANTYTLEIKQKVGAPSGTAAEYDVKQTFVVEAPEFVIDPGVVQTAYPPSGASGTYGEQLPFVALTDPSLPWERSVVPGADEPDPGAPVPWMALAIFAEGEIRLPAGSNDPVTTSTVGELLDPSASTLKPQLPAGWVSPDVRNSQCQSIVIPGSSFKAILPAAADLPYLAHCRAVRSENEAEVLLSVVLGNRLAVADARPSSPVPVRYYAHLVSLEGFADYLGPDGKPIPVKSGTSDPMDVQLVSLFHWTFVSMPETGQSFANLVSGLIASEQATTTHKATPALRLPVPVGGDLPTTVASRLEDGYVPLSFVTGAAEESIAWYRGPFTPVVPQPLPAVGSPPVPVASASSADELMIYLAEQGLFDLSYAAAWNIGRQLALADASFAQAVQSYRRAAATAAAAIAQRMAHEHLAGADPRTLLERDASRSRFAARVASGLGRDWTSVLAAVREGSPPAGVGHRLPSRALSVAPHPREILGDADVTNAISDHLDDAGAGVAAWLADRALLRGVPFSHLVPDPRMLPVESIRFFYVDPGWIDALLAGATSIAIHGSVDVALAASVSSSLLATARRTRPVAGEGSNGIGMTGVLIRSQVVSGWPELVVKATLGGAPVPLARDDCPAPTVRLCLFEGIPDAVSLAEPYQGLQFGVEDKGVYPRCVTPGTAPGGQLANLPPVAPVVRTPATGALGGVLEVKALNAALQAAVGLTPFANDAVVSWNGTKLATTFVAANQLKAKVPANLLAAAGKAAVTVVAGDTASSPATFTIDPPLAIDSLTPNLVVAGSPELKLTIEGTGFAAGAEAKWNGTALATTFTSAWEVSATVPATLVASRGTASITVESGGATTPPVPLPIVGPEPVIDSIAPNVATAGTSGFALSVTGSGFGADSSVHWNGAALATTRHDPSNLSASVPATLVASPGTASIIVNSGGEASNPEEFTIAGTAPTIGSIQPLVAMAGGGGFTLRVDGVNFSKDCAIHWNGSPVQTTFDDPQQLTADVPAALVAKPGEAAVTVVCGGATSNALPFSVVGAQPAIGLLEPDSAVAGSPALTLTVTGGFGAGDFALQMVKAPELQSFIPGETEAT